MGFSYSVADFPRWYAYLILRVRALTAQRANSPYSQNSTLHKPLQLRVTLRYFTCWKAWWGSAMFFVQLTPTRDSTSELLDALRQREVAVFGPSIPGQTRTPNEGNGTPKRIFFFKQKTAYEIGVRLVGSEMCIRDSRRLHVYLSNTSDWLRCVLVRKVLFRKNRTNHDCQLFSSRTTNGPHIYFDVLTYEYDKTLTYLFVFCTTNSVFTAAVW